MTSIDYYLELAQENLDRNDLSMVGYYLEKAVEKFPEETKLRIMLASYHNKVTCNYTESLNQLLEAKKLDKDHPELDSAIQILRAKLSVRVLNQLYG